MAVADGNSQLMGYLGSSGPWWSGQFELCYGSSGLVFLLYCSISREDKLHLLDLLVARMWCNISLIREGERLHISIKYVSDDSCVTFNNDQNACEYRSAIRTTERVNFQHASKTNFVSHLCSPIWKWSFICPKLSAVAKREKSHNSYPYSSLNFPSSKPQSHRPLQFTVLLSALLWPSQW